MSLKVCEIIDFANVFWNDFTPKSVAMFVTWYYWSFGFCSIAKNYDLQFFLRCTVYRKSMALYSYFGSRVYLGHFGLQKKNLYQNFKFYNVKGFATLGYLVIYLDLLPLLDFFLESFFLVFSGGGGGCSSSSLSSSSPCPSSSSSSSSSLFSLSLAPEEPSFRLVNDLGPLLVVALGASSTLGAVLPALSSSSLLPSELSLSPSDAYISTCKA